MSLFFQMNTETFHEYQREEKYVVNLVVHEESPDETMSGDNDHLLMCTLENTTTAAAAKKKKKNSYGMKKRKDAK